MYSKKPEFSSSLLVTDLDIVCALLACGQLLRSWKRRTGGLNQPTRLPVFHLFPVSSLSQWMQFHPGRKQLGGNKNNSSEQLRAINLREGLSISIFTKLPWQFKHWKPQLLAICKRKKNTHCSKHLPHKQQNTTSWEHFTPDTFLNKDSCRIIAKEVKKCHQTELSPVTAC